jgi:hypothetical protein
MAPESDLIETFVKGRHANCNYEFYVDFDIEEGNILWYLVYLHVFPDGEYIEFVRDYKDTHLQNALRSFYWQFNQLNEEDGAEAAPFLTDDSYYVMDYSPKITALLANRTDVSAAMRKLIVQYYV